MEAIGKIHGLELSSANADCVFLHDYGKIANVSHTGMVLRSYTSICNGHFGSMFAIHPAVSKLLIRRMLL